MRLSLSVCICAVLFCNGVSFGQLYWDTNGASSGSGNSGGIWNDLTSNWNSNPDGSVSTTTWIQGSPAVFAAGNDSNTTLKTISISGAVSTPSILFDDVALFNFTGGNIDVSGGSVFNTSILGATTNRSLNWSSAIIGTGSLNLQVNGDTSATGGASNSVFELSGANTFTGDVSITSGLVRSNSNFGNASNTITLNGGGIFDNGLNTVFSRNIIVGANGGVYRTIGGSTTGRISGAISGAGTFRRTDAGMLVLSGNGSGFSGTIRNENAAATSINAMNADWSNATFEQDAGTTTAAFFRFGGDANGTSLGTTKIKSLISRADIQINNGTILDIVSGSLQMSTRSHNVNNLSGSRGRLTSSSGTLTVTSGTPGSGDLELLTHDISSLIQDDISGPLTLVKNGRSTLNLSNINTYSGGTIVNEGRLRAASSSNGSALVLGTGPVTVSNGGQIYLFGGTSFGYYLNNFAIAGNGVTESGNATGAILIDEVVEIRGDISLLEDSRIKVQPNLFIPGSAALFRGKLIGSSDLEKTGDGTLSLRGDGSQMTGDVNIKSGRFNLFTNLGGNLNVSDNAALGFEGTIAGDLTLGTSTGAKLFIVPTTSNAFTVNGDLTVNGTLTVDTETPLNNSSTNVLSFGGTTSAISSNFMLVGAANYRSHAFIVNPQYVELTIDRRALVWNGANSATWERGGSQSDWRDPNQQNFYWADDVTFDDTAVTNFNVSLIGELRPSAVVVNSNSNAFSFNSTTGNQLAGSGRLTKEGSSILQINGANVFTGGTSIIGGTIQFNNANSLGSGAIVLEDGPNVSLLGSSSGIVLANSINTVASSEAARIGSTANSTGEIRYNGTITLNQRNLTIYAGSNGQTSISAGLTGIGDVRIEAADPAASRNLVAFFNAGFPTQNTFQGNITIGNGAKLRVTSGFEGKIPDTAAIYFDDTNSRFELSNVQETVGTLISNLSGAGVIERFSTNSARLGIGGDNRDGTYSGIIRENVNLTSQFINIFKIGTGNQIFTGNNTYHGNTEIGGGTLTVNGTHINAAIGVRPYAVNSNGTLAGSGVIGAQVTVNANGTLSPGESIESLAIGALTMASGSKLVWESINDSATGADLVRVNGSLSLNGVTLGLGFANLGSADWSLGDKLTLLSYSGAYSGTGFAGFLDDTSYEFGNNVWTINYNDTIAGTNYLTEATGTGHVTFTLTSAVPEPNTILFLGGCGLFIFCRRNRLRETQ